MNAEQLEAKKIMDSGGIVNKKEIIKNAIAYGICAVLVCSFLVAVALGVFW